MTLHVDVVKNDWAHDRRELGARVFPVDDDIKVDPQNGENWEYVVTQPFADPQTGTQLTRQDAIAFLEKLHLALANDYWFATGLHDDDTCPFREASHMPLTRGEPEVVRPARIL